MATYYIRKTGSDSNNGTSAATAWLTLGKAFNTGGVASVATTNTIYIGAGTYRETISPTATPSAMQTFTADVDGSQTGDPGDVILSAYTTDDVTTPSTTAVLAFNGKSHYTINNLIIIGANTANGGVHMGTASDDIFLNDCTIQANNASASCTAVNLFGATTASLGIQLTRCRIFSMGYGIAFSANKTSADYSTKLVIDNCFILALGARGISISAGSSGAGLPGSHKVLYTTIICGGNPIHIPTTAFVATALPAIVRNCILAGSGTGISAVDVGSVDENYNRIWTVTRDANVTDGANSQSGITQALLVELGQSFPTGRHPRPFFMPAAGSPLLNFGNDATYTDTVDMLNRPRPAGSGVGQSAGVLLAVGALERHDTAAKETTTTDSGGIGIVIVGPGDHDFTIPVDATATTVTIRGRYDSTHAATNKPQVQLVANAEIGVAVQTVTMTAAADTWETLTIGAFTPSAKGSVTLRVISRSAAGGGKAFFDTATVA